MSIQVTGGPTRVDSDDPIFTTHGVTWVIKFRQVAEDWRNIYILVKTPLGEWVDPNTPNASITGDFDQGMRDKGNSFDRFINEVFLVKLNAWLAETFKAGVTPPQVEDDKFVVLFSLAKSLKITAKADGTVVATLV